MAQTHIKTPGFVQASNSVANILAASDNELLELDVEDIDQLAVEVLPTTRNFDTFVMQAQVHPDSAYVQITNAITATPGGVVLAASGTLATLAAAATGWALLDVRPFFRVKFLASGTVDDTGDVTIRARGTGAKR